MKKVLIVNSTVNDSLKTDSRRLKTYKIKNHYSGKTYSVKAVNYTDAKKKYNKHIIQDALPLVEKIGDYTIKKNDDDFLKFVVFYKGQIIAETTTVAIAKRQIKQHMNDAINDLFTEDAKISKQQVVSVLKSAGLRPSEYSIDSDNYIVLYTYKQYEVVEMLEKVFGESSVEFTRDDGVVKIKGFVKDSLTEDALSKFVQSYLSEKKVSSKAEQDEIIKFLLERNKIVTEDIPKVRALLKIVKDSLTEDSKVAKLKSITNSKYVKVVHGNKENPDYRNYGTNLAKYYKISTTPSNYESTAKLLEKAGEKVIRGLNYNLFVRDSLTNDSLTEDADIAQNDIKASYLPEDANADNIQYLGFNEKRKLSFYSYGDRYFVHHDLEGRTEEVDKETVQKILKKNILGEIDENDLINKEPQSEEIVTDAADIVRELNEMMYEYGYSKNQFQKFLKDVHLNKFTDKEFNMFGIKNRQEVIDYAKEVRAWKFDSLDWKKKQERGER